MWDIRYFHFDIATSGLSFDGGSVTLPAGSHAIDGDVGGAEFDGLIVGRIYEVVFGSTTLTGPGDAPAVIVARSGLVDVTLIKDGAALPVFTTQAILLLFADGTAAAIQIGAGGVTGQGTDGVLPDSLVLAGPVTLDTAPLKFGSILLAGSFGGAAAVALTQCFCAQALIATLRGPRPAGDLQPGDLVLTRDRGYRPLRWVGRRRLSARELRAAERLRPVRIAAGALGPGQPARALLLSPQHRVLLAGAAVAALVGSPEVLVAARHLVGRPGVTVAPPDAGICYVHLLLDRHEIVLADGLWAESLYAGPVAMTALPSGQRAEILTLFPELAAGPGAQPAPARRFLTGAEARALRPPPDAAAPAPPAAMAAAP